MHACTKVIQCIRRSLKCMSTIFMAMNDDRNTIRLMHSFISLDHYNLFVLQSSAKILELPISGH